jgi:hypothetical protein
MKKERKKGGRHVGSKAGRKRDGIKQINKRRKKKGR